MAYYSNKSEIKKNTAHSDLIAVFDEVIKIFDNTIIYGNRSSLVQKKLYKKGRVFNRELARWVVLDKKKVVTYCDGYYKKSDHNYEPSRAIDAIPYPIDWKDTKRMYYFAGHVKMIAYQLKKEGLITHNIGWGGDWDNDTEVQDQTFMDLAHFYIIT